MNTTIQGSQTLFLGLQAEYRSMDEIITQHETSIPRLHLEVETLSRRVNAELSSVEERMNEFETWINEVRQSNMDTGIPMKIVNSLNEIIQEGASPIGVEVMQQVQELSQGIQNDGQATHQLRDLVVDLQEKFDSVSPQGINSSNIAQRDFSPQTVDGQISGLRSPQANPIERLEKQILQLINVFISLDQVNIALLKKHKIVDAPAVNSAIGNVQKALQKYVGFSGMDSEYCDRIG